MTRVPLNEEVMVSRLNEIRRCLTKLSSFQSYSIEQFKQGEHFAVAEHYKGEPWKVSSMQEIIS